MSSLTSSEIKINPTGYFSSQQSKSLDIFCFNIYFVFRSCKCRGKNLLCFSSKVPKRKKITNQKKKQKNNKSKSNLSSCEANATFWSFKKASTFIYSIFTKNTEKIRNVSSKIFFRLMRLILNAAKQIKYRFVYQFYVAMLIGQNFDWHFYDLHLSIMFTENLLKLASLKFVGRFLSI